MDGFFAALLSIILIDLVLSGDNALVIGMAVRNLPPRQKRLAILAGGGGALALRVALTALAAVLLRIPLIQLTGGLLLVWITYRLLAPAAEGDEGGRDDRSFAQALRTIIVADVSMSIDNVLAVGAAAEGNLTLLLIGLGLSMAIIIAGGSLVSVLLARLPWLIYVGGGVLLLLAGEMIAEDHAVVGAIGHHAWLPAALTAALVAGMAALLWARTRRAAPERADH